MPSRPTPAYNTLAYILSAKARLENQSGGMLTIRKRDGRPILTPSYFNMIGYRKNVALSDMVVRVARQGSKEVVDFATQLGAALQAEVRDDHDLLKANREIAVAMRSALRHRYGQSIERRKQVPSYSRKNRLSGALKRALDSSDMVLATSRQIKYLNQDRLNAEARHWARLNFGVRPAPGARRGAASTGEPGRFQWKLGGPIEAPGLAGVRTIGAGRVIGTLQIAGKPRPPMYLPAGYWYAPFNADIGGPKRRPPSYAHHPVQKTRAFGSHYGALSRQPVSYSRKYRSSHDLTSGTKRNLTYAAKGNRRSQQAFYPTRAGATFPTAGVVGVHYVDAGLEAFIKKFQPTYANMMVTWVSQLDSGFGRAIRKVNAEHRKEKRIYRSGTGWVVQ